MHHAKIVKKIMPASIVIRKIRASRTAILAIVACTMALAGCALTQPTDPYAPISRMPYTAMDQAVVASAQRPGRSIPIRGSLTLSRAIDIALANNPEIAAVQWDTAAAEDRQQVAQAAAWPTLSAEAGYGRNLDAQRLIPTRFNGEPGVFDRDIYRGDLVLRFPLFTGGRITNEIRAAELLAQSEQKRLARTHEELVFNLASTFYALLSQREVIRSLEFSISAMDEHHKQIADLLAAQKAARVDLLRTEVRIADLRQNLVREQNALAVYKRLLVNLMGVDQDAETIAIDGTLVTEPEPELSPDNLTITALKRRGDYLSARARLEAQAGRVDAARAGSWPVVNLVGSYGMKGAASPEDEGNATKSEEDVGAVGVTLTVPLFEGGRTAAQVRQERAALAAAQERLRKLELQIRREVETAALNVRSGNARIEAIRASIAQAKESLRIERMKYDLGSGSLTDVLDAQSALLQSETNFARAVADYRIALANLKLATGENSL
ncbi:MAG: TolC family protein [Desulfosarcina sp.]|nr:TolC family protein [Desulfosarcina sp.]